MIIKKFFSFIFIFFIYIFISVPLLAYAVDDNVVVPVPDHNQNNNETISGDVDDDGNIIVDPGENDYNSDLNISFTLFNHEYSIDFSMFDGYMPHVRNVIFYLLLIKSLYSKYKALPGIIGQIPVFGPSDQSPNETYKVYYNSSSGLFSIFKK